MILLLKYMNLFRNYCIISSLYDAVSNSKFCMGKKGLGEQSVTPDCFPGLVKNEQPRQQSQPVGGFGAITANMLFWLYLTIT